MAKKLDMKAGSILLLVGTKQGLFLIHSSDRQHWQIQPTTLGSSSNYIYFAIFDPRNHYRLFATNNGPAANLCYSDDFGQSWQEPLQGIQFPQPLLLKELWYIEPGPPTEPETVYLGTDPACLWESHDAGKTWEINQGLLHHPSREQWGRGLGGTCLHSIIRDFAHPERFWVGISGAGSLCSNDSGQSWQLINTMATQDKPEVGRNSHRLLQHPTQAEVLYQQSKNGIFKSEDGGDTWHNITSNLPTSFGFPLALDRQHPETLFTVMLDPEDRYTPGEQFAVYRTENMGQSWQPLTHGLPRKRMKVLRHALCTDARAECGVYVGSMSGELFASADRGEHWQMLSEDLPPIYSVTVIEYS